MILNSKEQKQFKLVRRMRVRLECSVIGYLVETATNCVTIFTVGCCVSGRKGEIRMLRVREI